MDKPLRLIEYLQELARFRSKVVYDLRDYNKHLWLSEIPHEKGCFTQAWGPSEEMPTIWIEVKKQEEPPLSEIPEICEDWANHSSLYQSDDLPELYPEINIHEQTDELNEDNNPIVSIRKVSISDHPEVENIWEKYLEEKWLPWRESHSKWEEIHKVYTKLFEIHQEQQKLGEEYELILGIGFLKWRMPNKQEVKRHLFTAKASLSFDPISGRFTVTEDEDGAKLDIEMEMLDKYRPVEQTEIKETLLSANDNPWERSSVDTVLSSLTNLLAEGQGIWHPKNIEPSQSHLSNIPVVDFAPALILRKRSMRGFELRLEEIRAFIERGEKLPAWFADLCENTSRETSKDSIDDSDLNRNITSTSSTLYFPLPYNEQQRKIAEKLTLSDGILVQGPPGTGKSLTIANLICHLLANEKRVLVTAKTPRALQVLHDKLPPQIQALCVSMLGQGLEERESLKKSVSQIHAKETEWDEYSANAKISELENQLHKTKSRLAELESRGRSIKEKDSYSQTVINGQYKGTASKIAEQLQKEKKEYQWLKDKINWNQEVPVSQDELNKLKAELRDFNPELKSDLAHELPILSDLPIQEDFSSLTRKEKLLQKKLKNELPQIDSLNFQIIPEKSNEEDIKEIVQSIRRLSSEIEDIRKRPLSWIEQAVFDMLTDKDTPCKELQIESSKRLNGLKERAKTIESEELQYPDDLLQNKILNDARKLKNHLQSGGKLGIGPFRPKLVKEVKYLLDKVTIDSEKVSSVNQLEKLIENLSVKLDIDYLWTLWQGKAEKEDSPLFMQVAELEECHEALESIVSLYEFLEDAKTKVSKINGVHTPCWHKSEEINEFLRTCSIALDKIELEEVKSKLRDVELSVSKMTSFPRMHPVCGNLLSAITERNEGQFTDSLSKLNEIHELKKRFKWINEQKGLLSDYIPIFVEDFFNDPNNSKWDTRFTQFKEAWNWACANSWIEDYLNESDLALIGEKIKSCEDKIKDIIADLVSEKAWKSCFPMLDEHRRNLKMFQNIKIPKTGKNVLRKRKEAQKYLEGCKDAIPAWIMPLHRVYDTISAKPDSFDVIIVDEASQCGPEALPLLFMGSKIIVVGDDKQISPMTVGTPETLINQTIDRLLHDFQYKESFDPRMSLFKQAEVRFSHQIYLREHFRCMPEIIRFSDNLCYAKEGKPLIPMRQFSATQRLDPLKMIHVPDGYREGSHSNAINQREAEKMVEIISQCCSDDYYENKTMGVIILQGHAQDKLIENLLLKEIGAEEMENRKLICGDSYSFQGDERDIIFLSMVAAPNERIGPFVTEDAERRFNVAASRAKDQMWLFHTATISDLGTNCLRRKLLGHFTNPNNDGSIPNANIDINELRYIAYNSKRDIGNQPKPFDSWFEVDVYLEIVNRGYRAIPQFECAGKYIDIVVEDESGSQLAVECDGDEFHGTDQYDADMQRKRLLERVGWKFHNIRECKFKASQAETLNNLWKELEYRGIKPIENTVAEKQTKQEGKSEEKPYSQSSFFEEMEDDTIIKVSNIQGALALKPSVLRETIIQTLKERPNQTSQKEALPGFVLKKLKIVSRGQPREAFCRKVKQAITYMRNHGEIEEYNTAKNKRVKLILTN